MLTPAKGTQLYTVAIAGCAEAQLTASGAVIAGGQAKVNGSPGGNFFSSHHGFIGGGCANCIDSSNGATTYGTNAGGELNTIAPGTNHPSILGGAGNTVSGSGSAILGASGNNDGGLNKVHIAERGIIAVLADTLHANGLWANAIPFIPGGVDALPGQIYWDTPPAPDSNPRVLYIGI